MGKTVPDRRKKTSAGKEYASDGKGGIQGMRSHKLVVAVSVLERELREKIRSAAEAAGWTAVFCESDEEAIPHLADAEVLLGQSAVLTRKAPALRWVCTPSAGINQFMAEDAFASPSAVLTNSSGAYGVTIAEHIVMVILEMFRHQREYTEIVGRRAWTRDLAVRSILDSRITLAGTGDIGQEAALRLRAFRPASLTGVNRRGRNPGGLFDRIVTADHLSDVLPETDILIVSLPGTRETARLLDAERLALLPDQALVVNVGRGTVIDREALEKELRNGRLMAALDVFEREPIPPEDSLWACPNLLITPHTAGNMTLPYTRRRIVDLFLEDFENYLAGKPLLRQVDLSRGY